MLADLPACYTFIGEQTSTVMAGVILTDATVTMTTKYLLTVTITNKH